jgi:hypothetical protein
VSVAAALLGECTAVRAPHIRGAAFAPPLPSLRLDRPCGRLVPSAAPVAGVALWVSGGTGPRDRRASVADLTLHQTPRLVAFCHMLSFVCAHFRRLRGGGRCLLCVRAGRQGTAEQRDAEHWRRRRRSDRSAHQQVSRRTLASALARARSVAAFAHPAR